MPLVELINIQSFSLKKNQYYLIQIQTFPPYIHIKMCESDSDSKQLKLYKVKALLKSQLALKILRKTEATINIQTRNVLDTHL